MSVAVSTRSLSKAVKPPVKASASKLKVGFVLTQRFTLTAFAGFIDALRLAADEGERSRPIECSWSVLGVPGVPIASSCNTLIQPWEEMQEPQRFDYIVVVGGLLHGPRKDDPKIVAFLRDAARAGVTLIGLCTGSFVLARAGLLHGYLSCVSWFHREEFVAEFPNLRLITNRVFVVDRDRMTCAGGTSVVYLAAHLIEKHCGRAHASKALRILIDDQPTPSNTLQPEPVLTRPARDSVVRRAMLLIEQQVGKANDIADVAGTVGLSMRQLERRFLSDVDMTPSEYRLQLRLARARWMIENTDLSMTEIGFECGFGDCSHFSRTFTSRFKLRPSIVRKKARAALARA